MFCYKCGYKLNDEAIFCSQCGIKTKLDKIIEQQQNIIIQLGNY